MSETSVTAAFADAAMLSEMFLDDLLMTTDLDLYLEASRRGREAVNFNHHIEANR